MVIAGNTIMPSALVVSFFPAFSPPSSGGELRLRNLYRALSTEYKVTMLTSTDFGARAEEVVHAPGFRELRFPKDKLWRNAYETLDRAGLSGDLSGLAFALAVSDPTCRLRRTARAMAASADVVIHEFPFSEPIFSDNSARFEIYNSHNFEASLLSSIVSGPGFEAALAKLMRLEGNLAARSKLVFATSAVDAEKFRLLYHVPPDRLACCPNGYDPEELEPVAEVRRDRPVHQHMRPKLLFAGSAHHPNVEAAHFLIEIAPQLPQCDLVIAGGVSNMLRGTKLPSNVTANGPYDEAEKRALLESADLFLNPVMLGSGTSLKALEALGAAVPMISTLEGVRGLHVEHDKHAVVVPRHEFIRAINRLLLDPCHGQELAARGLSLACAKYTWGGIAGALSEHIAAPRSETPPSRPLALALNDYPVTSTTSGGMARVRNLLSRLDLDIVLVSFGDDCEFMLLAPGLLHITVPKSVAHTTFERSVNEGQKISVNDAVASLFATSNPIMTGIVSIVARQASSVIFEHCYMAPLLDVIRTVRPDIPVVYSAHNVEENHKAVQLRARSAGGRFTAFIAELERRLVAHSNLIVCCTDADGQHFATANVETIVVPNGCSLPDSQALASFRPERGNDTVLARVGFLGSSHGPNLEAAEFILREIAPTLPNVDFEFVGDICTAISAPLPPNVRLRGVVEEDAKTRILAGWDIALNPVQSGGGSSLKLPDFMAHGLATINTPIGARGFDVAEHDAGTVVETNQFRNSLLKLLSDPPRLALQRANARRLATERFGWDMVTKYYRERIRQLSVHPSPTQVRRSLLLVTYRYTEPPLGGAEEYVIEVLKELRPHFDQMDLAAVNVGRLTNHHHFGCTFSTENVGPTHVVGGLFDRLNFFSPDVVPEQRAMELACNVQRTWAREEQELYAPFLRLLVAEGVPRLVSGFYWPEYHGGITRRWTSPIFSFLLPAGAHVVQLRGWIPTQKTLRLALNRVDMDGKLPTLVEHTQVIHAGFDVGFVLPPRDDAFVLLTCTVDEHQAEGDHRPLGVLLEGASVLIGEAPIPLADVTGIRPLTEHLLDLGHDPERHCRTEHLDLWVDTLRDLAYRRDEAADADFAELRGPHSAALQTWLSQHGADYDTVLVQGIPFDVIPRSVATLRRLPNPPRIVTLPHFHGDDRFYYWRQYLASFEAADATLLFSSSIADRIGPRVRFTVVPGGGIRLDERGDITAVGRFRAAHHALTPYFLVLGRKAPSKGYRQVLWTHAALRKAGVKVDLVMIGPDEDGVVVQGDGVHYLGQQPRAVIRGALSECLGLVNMSTSESFGIVVCEAWLFAKPVIVNRACYSFRELVRDNETGLLVSSDLELGEAMLRLANDARACERMGQAGFVEVMSRYTWQRVAESVFPALVDDDQQVGDIVNGENAAGQSGGATSVQVARHDARDHARSDALPSLAN
jgi:glycosyltransferase involved in cell wall biosynthesis